MLGDAIVAVRGVWGGRAECGTWQEERKGKERGPELRTSSSLFVVHAGHGGDVASLVSDIDIDVDEHGRGPDGFLHYRDYPPGLSPSQQDGDGAGGATPRSEASYGEGAGGATPRSEASYGEGAAEEFEEELDEEFDQEFDGSDGSYGSYGSSEGGRRSSDEGPDAPGDDAGDSCGEGDSYDGPRPPFACAHGGGAGAGPFPRPGDSRGSSAALRFARDGRVIGCGLARAWLSFPTYGRLVAHLAARLKRLRYSTHGAGVPWVMRHSAFYTRLAM